jgi:hypothetical protein
LSWCCCRWAISDPCAGGLGVGARIEDDGLGGVDIGRLDDADADADADVDAEVE